MFPEDDGRVHAVYSLREGDVTFYAGGVKSPGVETVEATKGGRRAPWRKRRVIGIVGRSFGIVAGNVPDP